MENQKNADAALAELAASGDEKAFEEIVARHKSAVFSVAARITGSAADAEEVAQNVFVKVYFSLRRFKAASSLYTWIYRIAVNASLDAVKKNRRRPVSSGDVNLDELPSPPRPGEFLAADEQVAAAEVKKSLNRLDEKYRAPLVLREYEGLKYDEIARILGISREQVKIRIFRAREFLRRMLDAGRGTAGEK